MFTLENILNYTSANIQIIGVFIAIIGGLIATKLLNTKIEKDTLKEKLEKLNKEIRFYQKRKITDEKVMSVKAYRELKEEIDAIWTADGFEHLIKDV